MEPRTSGSRIRCATDWATWPDQHQNDVVLLLVGHDCNVLGKESQYVRLLPILGLPIVSDTLTEKKKKLFITDSANRFLFC